MHIENNPARVAAHALEQYFDFSANYAHAADVDAEVLERLPNGEYAWLRPSNDVAEADDALYMPTEAGHDLVARMRAQEALFGHPWPTVAEAGDGCPRF